MIIDSHFFSFSPAHHIQIHIYQTQMELLCRFATVSKTAELFDSSLSISYVTILAPHSHGCPASRIISDHGLD